MIVRLFTILCMMALSSLDKTEEGHCSTAQEKQEKSYGWARTRNSLSWPQRHNPGLEYNLWTCILQKTLCPSTVPENRTDLPEDETSKVSTISSAKIIQKLIQLEFSCSQETLRFRKDGSHKTPTNLST